MILSSDATRKGAWANFYRFFNRYKWSVDAVLLQLLALIIDRLFPPGTTIILAVDDTLCRKRGLSLFGVGMHHDPLISSKGKKLTSWGHNWVVGLPSIDAWADDPSSRWTTFEFNEYGLHCKLRWKHQDALYYTVGGSRLLRIVLVEDLTGGRGRQVFFSTTMQLGVPYILRTYAKRWSIEVTFENSKQLLGIADPAVRKEQAVRRVAPMAGVLYGLIFLWFDEEGHRYVQFPDRPWYTSKRTPSFADMLTTLRRLSWEEKVKVAEKQGRLKKAITQITFFLSLAG